MRYTLVVKAWAKSWREKAAEKDVRRYNAGRTYLVCLLAVLVFRLAFETVCPVHFLCFMISAIDEHALGV
jgi:hypothetical protein